MKQIFELSDVQRAYYMGRRKEFELGGTSTHICYQFRTELAPNKLEEAMNKVIKQQGMLRARIFNENEQMIMEEVPRYQIPILDLQKEEKSKKEEILKEKRVEMFLESTDPAVWPQYRFLYIKMGEEKNVLLLSFDMLVADSSSLCLIGRELEKYYNCPYKEVEVLTASYEEYIEKQKVLKQSERYQKDKMYWQKKLDTLPMAPVLPVPKQTKNAEKELVSPISRITLNLEKDKWQFIKKRAEQKGLSPTSIVLAAYVMVLGKWSENKDFTINLTMSERGKYKENTLVGDYTTALLVGIEQGFYKDKGLFEVAKQVSREMLLSYRHNTFNGIEVMRELSRQRNMGTKAIMPIVFTSMLFKEDPFEILDFFGELEYGISQTPQVMLDCQATEYHGKLLVTWDYAVEYMDEKSLKIMGNQMIALLEQSLGKADSDIFQLLPEDAELWKNYNQTEQKWEPETLVELVYQGVCKAPKKIAIKSDKEEITYEELWNLSEQIKEQLLENGVEPGEYIGVSARRDISTLLNILGVLKCKAAYVPILEEYPKERVEFILKKSQSRILLEPFDWTKLENNGNKKIVLLEKGTKKDWERPAYVIFTSGSTGEPKGVVISNQSAVNTIKSMNARFEVNEKDVILGISSLCFDLSVYDVFGTFFAGATLVLVQEQKNGEELEKLCREEGVTIWNSVPALCELLLSERKQEYAYSKMRYFFLSGDWIPLTLPGRLKQCFKNARVVSLGGATEASIWSIAYVIDEVKEQWNSIPYGSPLDNQKIYVLDEEGKLCPPEVTGEICIGGIGVADGYLNDKEKTEQAFKNQAPFGRIYHTGDYGKMHRCDEQIEFLGRRDAQVKVNGYRIETREIEVALLGIAGIQEACVLVEGEQFKRILAFYCLSKEQSELEIRNALEKKLPAYMIPSQLVEIVEMPLTSNGKVDRTKLLQMKYKENVLHTPKNEEEKLLLQLWKQILGIEEIGVNQNFFSLGGDSIKAIQILSALKRLGYQVDMKELYTHATIELLATIMKKYNGVKEYQDVQGTYPITPAQQWFFRKIKQGRNRWNQYISITLTERLQEVVLQETIEDLLKYHDVLRTVFVKKGNQFESSTRDRSFLKKSYVFCYKKIESEEEIQRENDLLESKFDIEKGPLLGIAYYEWKQKAKLYFFVHHLLTDGVSLRLLLNDFVEIYTKRKQGETIGNYQAETSYMEWAAYMKKTTQKDSDYWLDVLKKGLELNKSWQLLDGVREFELKRIEQRGEKSILPGKDIEEYLLAVFLKAFSKLSNRDGIMVEMEYHGREDERNDIDIQNTMGWFSYTYPVIFEGLSQEANIDSVVNIVHDTLGKVPEKGKGFAILQAEPEFEDYPVLIHFNYLGSIDSKNYG